MSEMRQLRSHTRMNPFHLGELLDLVFSHLTVRDLGNLRLTCRQGRDAVDAFALSSLNSKANQNEVTRALTHFYQSNRHCLLVHERQVLEAPPEKGANSFQRLWLAKECIKDGITRFLVADADIYDTKCRIVRNNLLQRDMVRAASTSWLPFEQDLGYHTRGNYKMRIRFKIPTKCENISGTAVLNLFQWGDIVYSVIMTLENPRFDSTKKSTKTFKVFIREKDYMERLMQGRLSPGSDGWMYMVVTFTLDEDSKLLMQLECRHSPRSKRGSFWDFVEIQKYSK